MTPEVDPALVFRDLKADVVLFVPSAENVKVSETAPLPPAPDEATPERPNPQSEDDIAEKKVSGRVVMREVSAATRVSRQ